MRGQVAKWALYGLSALAAVAAVFVALALLASASSPSAPEASAPAQSAQQSPSASASAPAAAGGEEASSDRESPSAAQGREPEAASQQEHAHTWETTESVRHVPETSHVETVSVEGADIIEYHTECGACGEVCDGEDALAAHYQLNPTHTKAGYITGVPVVVGKEPSTTEERTVVDSEARDEVVATRRCSVCGAEEVVSQG